jgi:hypothetical protein
MKTMVNKPAPTAENKSTMMTRRKLEKIYPFSL